MYSTQTNEQTHWGAKMGKDTQQKHNTAIFFVI